MIIQTFNLLVYFVACGDGRLSRRRSSHVLNLFMNFGSSHEKFDFWPRPQLFGSSHFKLFMIVRKYRRILRTINQA